MNECGAREWLCSVALLSDFCVLSSPSHHISHTHSLAKREATHTPGSAKIKCMSFMETLCSSGTFGAPLHVWRLCFDS